MDKLGKWLLKEKRNAAGVALLFSLLPILGLPVNFITSLVIGLVSLQKGAKDGLFVVFWACLPAAIIWYIGGSFSLIVLLVSQYFLVNFLGDLWRRYQSLSLLLEIVAAIGIVGLIVISLYWPGLADLWARVVTTATDAAFAEFGGFWKSLIVKSSAGIMMTLLLISNIVNLLIARAWQSVIYKPKAFGKEFLQVRAGKVIAMLFLLCVVGALLDISLALHAAYVTAIPLVFSGIALIHSAGAKQKYKTAYLILFYAGLILFSVYLLPVLVVIGFFDAWFDVRKRQAAM